MPIEVDLPRTTDAPGQARHLLQERFGSTLDSGELDAAKLLVTELVTNALRHGDGTITLRALLDDDKLLVEVLDEGSGFEWTVREADFHKVGGWGLKLVDAEASRWGVHEGSTHVWFELERPGPRLGPEKKPPLDASD